MRKNEKRTHGTAATGVPVAEMLASEARRDPRGGREKRVQRPLSMPFPRRSIERVLRDLATPSNQATSKQPNHFPMFSKHTFPPFPSKI